MKWAIILALLVATVALPLRAGANASLETAAKTLARDQDPVIVRTGLLGGLPDHETSRYRLYALRRGRLEPIPFQFDARGADGELVLSENGTDADFTFDDDDELVFMAKDTGDRVSDDVLPGGDPAALELAVVDRAHGGIGWAYLIHFTEDPPPRSPVRYATFDTASQEARGLTYEVSYSHDRSNFLGRIRIVPRDGTAETLIERLRMRISPTFALLWTTVNPTLTEESFSVVPDGVKNGPVRAIRRVRQSLDLGPMFPEIPNGRVYTYYYATSFQTPVRFSIPWLALKALRDFRYESVDELGSRGEEMRYWDAANPEGVAFDGSARPAATDADHDWWVVSGARGMCLQAFVIPAEWRSRGIKRGIVFNASGTDPGAGYSLLRMTNLERAGTYDLVSGFVFLPRPYRPGDESEALDALREPLHAEVHVVAPFIRRASAAR
jgi:hypothetical protein